MFFCLLNLFCTSSSLRLLKIIKLNLIPLFSKCAVALTAMLGAIWIINQKLITSGLLKFFFTGASHGSVTTRWKGIIDYWNIFLENPFFGVGLGAAPFYYALKEEGSLEGLLNSEILVKYCPTNAFTELLASLGLLGLIFFALFIFLLIQTFRSTHKIIDLSIEERINLIAMAVSLSVMFVVLQFNQSITRPYLWVHVGIFVGYAQTLKIKYRKQTLTITGQ
jgi:O-antigen ligase